MLILHTVPGAIGLMVAGIFLLGMWPAVWHQVERAGRVPTHTFLDYSLAYLAFAATCALTLGQLGPTAVSPTGQPLQFLDQLQQHNWQMVLFALAGGTCLALGDLALQYSIGLCGLSVGPPTLNSITLIVGVVLAYFLDGGINKPQLVFTGAACAAAAVGLGAAAHVVNHRAAAAAAAAVCTRQHGCTSRLQPRMTQQQQQQQQQQHLCRPEDSAHGLTAAAAAASKVPSQADSCSSNTAHTCSCSTHVSAEHAGVPDATVQCSDVCLNSKGCELAETTVHDCGRQQHRRARAAMIWGLAVSISGGVIYGCFMPAFQVAANDPFGLLQPSTPPLSVYTTYFYFSLAFTAVSVAANAVLMQRPPFGGPPSSISQYLRDHRGRGLSLLSGLLAAAGDLTQFIGGQTVGYAAAMMVMAYPVVGVLWGLLRYREHRAAPAGGQASAVPWGLLLVVGQLLLYVLSVGLLSGSAELRVAAHT